MGLQDFLVSQLSNDAYARRVNMQNEQLNALRAKAYEMDMAQKQRAFDDQESLRNRLADLKPYYTVNGERPQSFLSSVQPPAVQAPLGPTAESAPQALPASYLSQLQMQPQSDYTAPQPPPTAPAPKPAPFVRQEPTTADRMGVITDEALRGNTAALPAAQQSINLIESVAKLKAMGASPEQYFQAQQKVGLYKAYIDDLVSAFKTKQGKALAPMITEQYAKMDPDIAKVDPATMFSTDGETGIVAYPGLGTFVRKPESDEFHFVPEEKKPNTEFEVFMAEYGPKMGQAKALEAWHRMEVQKKAAGATRVSQTVSTKEQTEEAKAVGKAQGERYVDIVKGGDQGIKQKGMYDRLEQLLDGVNTGKLTPMGTQVASLAASLGLNVDKNLGNKQAAQALGNMLALELRNPSGGAGMPGAMSDKDREFLTSSVPGLSQSPQANKLMIQYAKAVAQRNQDISKLATQYRQQNGTLDIGFNEFISNWSDSHPLFVNGRAVVNSQVGGGSMRPSQGGRPKGASSAAADSLRKKYGIGR